MDLDASLRDHVLIPLTAIIVLIQLLRSTIQSLPTTSKVPLSQVKKQAVSVLAKQCPTAIPFVGARIKAQLLSQIVEKKAEEGDPLDQMLQQQQSMQGMMGGMKNNMLFIVPQSILFGWINWSFSEFVLLKVPFALPNVLGEMLQRGIEADLPNEFVSALSWYFLNVFASGYVLALVTGFNTKASNDMAMMMPAMPGQEKKEKEMLEGISIVKTDMDALYDAVLMKVNASY